MGKVIPVNQVQGLLGTVHAVETQSSISIYDAGVLTVDGVTPLDGRKYLLAAQNDPRENGIYVYQAAGSFFLRPTDDDNLESTAEIPLGSEVFVSAGTVNEGEKYRLIVKSSSYLDGYENDVARVEIEDVFFRRVGNRPAQFVWTFDDSFPGALLMDGSSTIGDYGSGADYAGPHYEWIFEKLKSIAPNAGTEDWSSGDTVTMFDGRGRVMAGRDNMGGTAANRLTSQSKAAIAGDTLGASAGSQEHTQTIAEMPSHAHPLSASQNSRANGGGNAMTNFAGSDVTGATGLTGGDEAMNNLQPTGIADLYICI